MASPNSFITSAGSLVTTHDQIRAGFLRIALEKNRVSDPYVKNALAFKAMVAHTTSADDFLGMPEIRPFLLTAAGLSDKSKHYLTDSDQTLAIKELIDKFLKPAGENYIDETTFRYLLIKGDAVGGTMRNKIGALGEERFIRAIFSSMDVREMECFWLPNTSSNWQKKKIGEANVESQVKALSWSNKKGSRILCFNMNVPIVKKNIDICLYSGTKNDYQNGNIVKYPNKALMFGELKGGIDPAGADEHWKTGNTALLRIRSAFQKEGLNRIKTSFVAAAIANAMANEIYEQLLNATLDNAANLTNNNQLTAYCNWLIEI